MKQENTPPANTRWIMRGADLPPLREPAKYAIIATDGSTKEVVLRKRQRQVVDLLTQGPVYCASPVRLSDIVHILKREIGLEVETEMYPGDEDNAQYGVYFLKSKVVRIADERVAA
ncbi:MAG: hypothetical protein AAF762_10620 [Pseudomonadota bacterium]